MCRHERLYSQRHIGCSDDIRLAAVSLRMPREHFGCCGLSTIPFAASRPVYLSSSESVRRKFEECRCERDCTRSGTPVSARSPIRSQSQCACYSPFDAAALRTSAAACTMSQQEQTATHSLTMISSLMPEWAGRADRSCDLLLRAQRARRASSAFSRLAFFRRRWMRPKDAWWADGSSHSHFLVPSFFGREMGLMPSLHPREAAPALRRPPNVGRRGAGARSSTWWLVRFYHGV